MPGDLTTCQRWVPHTMLWAALALPLAAQPPRPYTAQRLGSVAISGRWTYPGEGSLRAGYDATFAFQVDSVTGAAAGSGRTAWLSSGSTWEGMTLATLSSAHEGEEPARRYEVRAPAPAPQPRVARTPQERAARPSIMGLVNPTWDPGELLDAVVLRTRHREISPGVAWREPVDLHFVHEGRERHLTGQRQLRVERDTLIAGRRHWVMRDSALVSLLERGFIREYTLDALTSYTREGSGIQLADLVFDDSLGLVVARTERMSLSGRTTITYPSGESYESPVTFDGSYRWTVLTPQAYAATERQRREEEARRRGGMLRELGGLPRRVRDGDRGLRDSLLRLVRAAPRDPDNSRRVSALAMDPDSGRIWMRTLPLEAIAQGDTLLLLEMLNSSGPSPLTATHVRMLLAWLNNPQRVLTLGRLPDETLGRLAHLLVTQPPALDDTTRLCEPAACALLADARRAPNHPRVRDLGLMAAAMGDPRRFGDSLRARARVAPAPFREAMQLLDGIGATWPSAKQLPMPSTGAEWREWLDWLEGHNPAYPASPQTAPAGMLPPLPRFEGSHHRAIRFHQLVTGRDIRAEVARGLATAASDSARLVLGTMALHLDAVRTSWDSLALALTAGSMVEARLAIAEVDRRRSQASDAQPVADTAVAAELLDAHLEAMMVGRGAARWRHIAERFGITAPRPEDDRPSAVPRLSLDDASDAGVIARWRDRIPAESRQAWDALPDTIAAARITVGTVRKLGPFYEFTATIEGQSPRPSNAARARWASGTSFVLLRWNNEWWVVSVGMWIT